MKNILRGFSREVFFFLVFAGFLLYMTVPDVVIFLKPAISFEELLEEDGRTLEAGSHVSGRVPYVLEHFASESTYTQRSDGSRSGSRSTGRFYPLFWTGGLAALKCRQADVETLDQLAEETYLYLMTGEEPTTVFSMEGKAEPLNEKLTNYYREYMADMDFTADELDALGQPLCVRYVNFTAVWVMFAIGVLLAVLGVLLFLRRYRLAVHGSGLQRAEDLPDVP
ncbi:MAG: hypothetical protein HFG26_03720 [Provencibacterium sp.]|jgi:hypothetical protein|nr:hypothetical protein [Provencibacterium sp.]